MQIQFADAKLAAICNSHEALQSTFNGSAPAVRLVLAALQASADPFKELPNVTTSGDTTMFKTMNTQLAIQLTVDNDVITIADITPWS